MENNKYYIPDIEDIHIGYECELKLKENSKTKWCKIIIEDGQDIEEIVRSYCYGIPNDIRTPYLTKEQIEAEGWIEEERDKGKSNRYTLFVKDGVYLLYDAQDDHIKIDGGDCFAGDACDSYVLFDGSCPSINEFRYICKLLNIK